MSIFDDTVIKNVAEVAAKIMNQSVSNKPIAEDEKKKPEILTEKVGDFIFKTDWNGPGKGRHSTELSPEEHINAANWHSDKISELKSGKMRIYGKPLSRQDTEERISDHKKMMMMHFDMGTPSHTQMSDEESKRVADVVRKIKQDRHEKAFSYHELPLKDYRQVAKENKESFSDLISTYKERGFKGLSESIVEDEKKKPEMLTEMKTSTYERYKEKSEKQVDKAMNELSPNKMNSQDFSDDDIKTSKKIHNRLRGIVRADKAIDKKLRKESFSDLISTYKERGFKGLSESIVAEEVDNETFAKELKDQQDNSEGKKKKKIAAAADMSVVIQKEDALEERELSPEEQAKKEKIVKAMKKNLGDFKKRYGDRAKDVMYATATQKSKED